VSTELRSHQGHRYQVEIINQCVWLRFRLPLSFRELEEMMLERRAVVSYETIRRGAPTSDEHALTSCADAVRDSRQVASQQGHRQDQQNQRYLWRAVVQHGNVHDVLIQPRRNGNVAKRFFRKLPKGFAT
jgi:putative transposase